MAFRNLARVRLTASAVLMLMLLMVGCSADPALERQEYLESGNRYFEKAEYPQAIIEYRNALRVDPAFGEARARLAAAYEKSGDSRRAMAEYIRAADSLPTDFDVQVRAGKYLLAARQPKEALARADAAVKLKPEDVDAHLLRAHAFAGMRSFDDALDSIEKAIRLDPGRGDTYLNLGAMELARRGDKTDAEDAFKKGVALAPNSVESHLALGYYYWTVGQAKDAEHALQQALQIDPANGIANRLMAVLMIVTERRAEAEPYLLRNAMGPHQVTGTLGLADYYLQGGRPRDAIARLEALAGDNRTIAVRELLARAYIAVGDSKNAKALSDELLATDPKHVLALMLKGRLLMNENRTEEALAAVRAAVEAEPSSAEAHFLLGRVLAAKGDGRGAESAYRQVLTLNPQATPAQVQLANVQTAGGNPTESVRAAQEATKSEPSNVAARIALARSLLSANDLARAGRELVALQKEHPNVAEVHNLLGMLALIRNNIAPARAAFDRALAIEPASLDALAGHIALDVKENNLPAGRARIENRLKEGPVSSGLLLLAARTYLVAQDQAAAEKVLRQVIETDPSQLAGYAMLGQLYMSQKKLDQAIVELEALAARQSKPVAALTMSAMVMETQGKTDLATKRYLEVLALDSSAAIASNNLAWIYADSGTNLDAALALAQMAVSKAPDTPEVLDTLGWVYYKKNLPQLAIPLFARCVEKAPRDASYHYHLGLAYLQSGDQTKGRAALQRALEAKPDARTAEEIRGALGKISPAAPQ